MSICLFSIRSCLLKRPMTFSCNPLPVYFQVKGWANTSFQISIDFSIVSAKKKSDRNA